MGRNEGPHPAAIGPARRASAFSVGTNRLHSRGGLVPRGRGGGRHASPSKVRRNSQADSGKPGALHRTGRKKKTVSPDLYRISAAADRVGAVRFDLARAPAFEIGQPSSGGTGGGYGGHLQRATGLPRRYPRHRRTGRTGAVIQQHGGAA